MPKFTAKDYNFVAKRFREQAWFENSNDRMAVHTRATLTVLALDFARSYAEDNPEFKPDKFLDACSPDKDKLPLGELWEDE